MTGWLGIGPYLVELKMAFKFKITAAALGLGLMSAVASTGANAATVACSATVASKVVGDTTLSNGGCEVSTTADQDFLETKPTSVNAENFFGFSDWSFISKTDNIEATSGIYDVSSVFNNFSTILAIFKSGKKTFLTGYVLNDETGTWSSPFSQGNSKPPKDVSHISYYGRDAVSPVPLPAAGFLLIGALGGLAAMRRRKTV